MSPSLDKNNRKAMEHGKGGFNGFTRIMEKCFLV
jgi:hypothetical protein